MGILDSGTILTISIFGVPYYSARQLKQTYTPIKDIRNNRNNLVRTINGVLTNLTPSIMLKYATTISAKDQAGPANDLLWPGQLLTINCCAPLTYPVGLPGAPGRGVVSGSSSTSNGFTSYLPIMNVMVIDFDNQWEEWPHEFGWKLECEEV